MSFHGLKFSSILIAILASQSACGTAAVQVKPSSIINLDNWKLSVPVVSNDGGNPSEVIQPELRDYTSQYMFAVPERKEVVFQTPNRSAIQPGSDFPRTELREMTDGGHREAGWSTSVGTHELVVEQAVTVLPNVNPFVTVGQIHDANGFIVMIRLDGVNLYAKTQDGKVDSLNDHYKLGTFFRLKIIAGNGAIAVYYDDELKASHKKKCSSCYFKAGMYLQTNPNTGESAESFGEVRIRSLEVSHY